ncbi:MAG TPA: glycosyltransferase family protein [Sediminibacterium sp.]|nr:glycosyltransferase family protein [Sediminibacterium sp.]
MKILYAVQATGNGHISRAMELLPFLEQYGTVDVFLSGNNSHLQPALPVKFRSKGLSLFYGNKGGLDYWKMLKDFSIRRIWNEAHSLPVEYYDIVLNDFDSITSLACKLKKVPCVGFGHQASFRSDATPRAAKKDLAGELVLKNYATATAYTGLHFAPYDDFIFSPVIKSDVLRAIPVNKGHITVYLSHYSDEVVMQSLQQLEGIRFELFSKKVKEPLRCGNITLHPISNDGFTNSMIHSAGVITGAGFETPAEALYLGKKLLCLPIRGQYEQWCNAAALEKLGVRITEKIDVAFATTVAQWLDAPAQQQLVLQQNTYEIVQHTIELARSIRTQPASEADWISEEDFITLQ